MDRASVHSVRLLTYGKVAGIYPKPKWSARCISVENISSGWCPLAYVYRSRYISLRVGSEQSITLSNNTAVCSILDADVYTHQTGESTRRTPEEYMLGMWRILSIFPWPVITIELERARVWLPRSSAKCTVHCALLHFRRTVRYLSLRTSELKYRTFVSLWASFVIGLFHLYLSLSLCLIVRLAHRR